MCSLTKKPDSLKLNKLAMINCQNEEVKIYREPDHQGTQRE